MCWSMHWSFLVGKYAAEAASVHQQVHIKGLTERERLLHSAQQFVKRCPRKKMHDTGSKTPAAESSNLVHSLPLTAVALIYQYCNAGTRCSLLRASKWGRTWCLGRPELSPSII
jgi:hypothetical protein